MVLRIGSFLWLASAAVSAATIHIDPISRAASVGGTVDLRVSVSDVFDLYAYQFDIAFDPGILTASTVTEANFLAGGGGTFFIPGAIDNVGGTIMFTVSTLLGPTPGVNGTGALAVIRFVAKAAGSSGVTLSNIVLLDSIANDISVTVGNGSVDVMVPETSAAVLMAAGISAVLALRKRTNRQGR